MEVELTPEPGVYIFMRRIQKPAYLAFTVMFAIELLIDFSYLFRGQAAAI